MTEQNGGQPPAGWYPDGTGQLRYWDGATWTEHVQPQEPEVPAPAPPAPPAQAAQPAAPAAAAAAAPAAAVPAAAAYDQAPAGGPEPFYKKPAALAVIGAVLLLVVGGAAFALIGGSDDDEGGPVAKPGGVATSAAPSAAAPATKSFTLNCEPVSKIEGSNNQYPFNLTLTVTPTEVSVSSDTSIKNTGPTTIEVGAYRFDAVVAVNGTPLNLVGATNLAEAQGDPTKDDIFKATEAPLVAKAALPAGTTGTPTVVLNDIYFNNIKGSTGTEGLTDTFDSRCNTSATPNLTPTPIGLSVPAAS